MCTKLSRNNMFYAKTYDDTSVSDDYQLFSLSSQDEACESLKSAMSELSQSNHDQDFISVDYMNNIRSQPEQENDQIYQKIEIPWNYAYTVTFCGICNILRIFLLSISILCICYISIEWLMLGDELASAPIGVVTCQANKHWQNFKAFTARDSSLVILSTCLVCSCVELLTNIFGCCERKNYYYSIGNGIIAISCFVTGMLCCIIEDKLRNQFGNDYFRRGDFKCALLRRLSTTSNTNLAVMSAILVSFTGFLSTINSIYQACLWINNDWRIL
ncbi:hypothetical protein GJ496_006581 [Pomphorhynchus laevis]|nr:hypothetical protein GJ496_006581 [Pomphorhynchus laevis]